MIHFQDYMLSLICLSIDILLNQFSSENDQVLLSWKNNVTLLSTEVSTQHARR